MPLPNRPVVESIDSGVFKRMSFFLPVQEPASGTIDPFGGETKPEPRPAGEIVERKEIGAHALTTVRVEDSAGFSQWVKDEFGAEGKIEIPDPLLKVIQLYLDDGYDWFLFDTVDLSTAFSEKETLKIRFQTDHLYYPMRITRWNPERLKSIWPSSQMSCLRMATWLVSTGRNWRSRTSPEICLRTGWLGSIQRFPRSSTRQQR
jgi:hypothetical protein